MFDQHLAVIAVGALIGAAALQVILALAGYQSRRRVVTPNQELRDAQREIHSLHVAVTALARRVGTLEVSPAPTAVMPAVPAPVRREPVEPAYDLAGKLARRGASTEELMETCGLSRGEVELIARLNAPAGTDGRARVNA